MIRALEGIVRDFDSDSLTAAVVVGGVHHEIRVPAFASSWAERSLDCTINVVVRHIR